jgi:hypothetical protein
MTGLTATLPCPSQDDLAQFQRGEAPSGRIDELAEHLEICSDCQAALAQLSVACDELLKELRRVADIDWCDDSSLVNEMAALESELGAILVHYWSPVR